MVKNLFELDHQTHVQLAHFKHVRVGISQALLLKKFLSWNHMTIIFLDFNVGCMLSVSFLFSWTNMSTHILIFSWLFFLLSQGTEFTGSRKADIRERQRLVQLVQLQAQEIDALKDEITLLSRKGGHILPPAQPPLPPGQTPIPNQ